jgi:hypothetical protein
VNLGGDSRTGYRTDRDVESGRYQQGYGTTSSYRDQPVTGDTARTYREPVAGETGRTYRDQPVVGHDDRSMVQKLTGQSNIGNTTDTTASGYREQPVTGHTTHTTTHGTRDLGIVA